MQDLRDRIALVTGGSGGLGRHIAQRLATEGMGVVVSGRREDALGETVDLLKKAGARAAAVPADLSQRGSVSDLVERAEAQLGSIDVLVNNAGVETIAAFTAVTPEELIQSLEINLVAPMLLTRAVAPGMLQRRRGHVVFVSSLAGKMGQAYVQPYAAAKAGLIALTQSLRAEYAGSPVGFSAVCPGFVLGDGMYQRMVDQGVRASRLVGETTVGDVVDAVIRAIRTDAGELLVNSRPMRPLLALAQLSPGLVERVAPRFGVSELFGRTAAARGRAG